MNRVITAFVMAALLVLVSDTVKPCFGQQKFEVNEEVADWILQESTGRLFAALKEGNSVVEFDQSGKEKRRFEVGRHPAELLIKNGKLVVACHADTSIYVLDLKTNKLSKRILIPGQGPFGCFCSKVKNNFVYAITNKNDSFRQNQVLQIDIANGVVKNKEDSDPWRHMSLRHVTMSPDGKRIITDNRSTSGSSVKLFEVNEEKFQFKSVLEKRKSFGQVAASHNGRYWVLGNLVYSSNMKREKKSFEGSFVALHDSYDLVASLKDESLYFQKFSDRKILKRFQLEKKMSSSMRRKLRNRNRGGRRPIPWNFDPTLQFDRKNNRVFVGKSNAGFWVDLKKVSTKFENLVQLKFPQSMKLIAGEKQAVRVEATGKAKDQKLSLELESSPKWATLSGGTVSFQPAETDVGQHEVSLKIVDNETKKVLDRGTLDVSVSLPGISLDIDCSGISISKSGKYGAVWGFERVKDRSNSSFRDNRKSVLFVIDLQKNTILGRKQQRSKIKNAAMDDKNVYLIFESESNLLKWDLNLTSSKRKFLNQNPMHLSLASPGYLYIKEGHRDRFLETESLKDVSDINIRGQFATMDFSIFPRNNEFLHQNSRLPSLNVYKRFQKNGDSGSRYSGLKWGRFFDGRFLRDSSGATLFNFGHDRFGFISQYAPMGVSIDRDETRPTGCSIELINLEDGGVVHRIKVGRANRSNRSFVNYRESDRVKETKERIYFLHNNSLRSISVPKAISSKLTTPTHISSTGKSIINVSEKAQVKLTAGGSKKSKTFRLLTKNANIKMDEKTGTITVNTKNLWNSFLRSISVSNTGRSGFRVRNSGGYLLDFRMENIENVFEKRTGTELPKSKFPTELFLCAEVNDEDGGSERVHFSVLVVGDRGDVTKKINESKIANEKVRKQAEERRKQRLADMQKQREMELKRKSSNEQKLEARVEMLEKKIRRLEATLDAVLQKLEKEKGGTGG